MEKYANLFIFGLVIITALITLIITLRIRQKKQRQQLPDLGEVTDILSMEDNSIEDDFIFSEVRGRDNPLKSPSGQSQANQQQDRALSELGFNNISSMFTNNQPPDEVEEVDEGINSETTATHFEQKHSDLIIVHIMAQSNHQFMGYDLLQALLAAGLRYGEMSIFHRYQDADRGGKIIFSLASATEPGIFDMNKMGMFSCKGLSLFMQLQQPYHNLASLELFIMTAQQLAEDLDGLLQDGKHRELTEDTIFGFRTQVRRFQSELKLPA